MLGILYDLAFNFLFEYDGPIQRHETTLMPYHLMFWSYFDLLY